MKPCCYCQVDFVWHFARHVTYARKDGVARFMVEPRCRHIAAFAKEIGTVEDGQRAAWEAKWDAEAERLFAEYTQHWTDAQRAAFRAKIFPTAKAEDQHGSYVANAPWRTHGHV